MIFLLCNWSMAMQVGIGSWTTIVVWINTFFALLFFFSHPPPPDLHPLPNVLLSLCSLGYLPPSLPTSHSFSHFPFPISQSLPSIPSPPSCDASLPPSGDGKTHYIKQQLAQSPANLTVAVNEAFSPLNAITKLRTLPLSQKNCAIFFNFTLLPPGVREG